MYAFTNEWLDAAARISAEGGKAKDVSDLWRSNAILEQFDTIVLPSDFVDDMLARLYATDKSSLLRSFSDLGREVVGVLKIVAGSIEELARLVTDFTFFTPIKRFEVRKVDEDSDELIVVGAGKKMESTECCFEFLKAVLNGYGYDISKHELYTGTIRVTVNRPT